MSRRPLDSESKEKLNKSKTEYSDELDMKFNDGYNEIKPSKLNESIDGLVGGSMAKKIVEAFQKKLL